MIDADLSGLMQYVSTKRMREKSQQVRKIDKIFREAKYFLYWLERDDNTVAEDCFPFLCDTRIAMEREF